jgi:putative ABC transport system substrate-binding protein
MKLREAALGVSLGLVLLAVPVLCYGQQPAKVYRIGFLVARASTGPATTRLWEAFAEGLREHGYVDGQNVVIERRYTEGRAERAPALAAELVSLKPDLIVAHANASVRAAKQATSAIPIVMVGVTDPVGLGLVASLAHPGGNVTGLTGTVDMQIMGKRLQLLKQAVPTVSRVAVLSNPNPDNLWNAVILREIREAARALGVTLQFYGVRAPEEFEGTFTAMTKARADALLPEQSTFIATHVRRIVGLAAKSRLPAVYFLRDHAEAGGLMSYGYDQPAGFRRLGFYVDKIFKGANPGDLPVEQPTKFDLVINLKTAKTLGLTIPQTLLMQAEEVIE